MTETISLPLWHLVVYVLCGVTIGAVISLLPIVVVGRRGEPRKTTLTGKRIDASPSETSHEFLDRCVNQGRALSIDEVASLLDITPRRVSRLLTKGVLVAVQMDGGRRVTAISVHDYLIRETVGEEVPPGMGEHGTKSVTLESAKKLGEGLQGGGYQYYVDGNDEAFTSLDKALEAAGIPLDPRSYRDWKDLPTDIKTKVHRVKVQQ